MLKRENNRKILVEKAENERLLGKLLLMPPVKIRMKRKNTREKKEESKKTGKSTDEKGRKNQKGEKKKK